MLKPEKQIRKSDFDSEILQRVSFWIENFSCGQVLNWKVLQRVRF